MKKLIIEVALLRHASLSYEGLCLNIVYEQDLIDNFTFSDAKWHASYTRGKTPRKKKGADTGSVKKERKKNPR